MSLNVGKLQATLEVQDTAFVSALERAKAAMQQLATEAQNMGRASQSAGSEAAQGSGKAAEGSRKQAQEAKRAGDESRRAGQAGRQAGEEASSGATRAATSIKSTGDAAQSLRERFTQASQQGRQMGEQVSTGTQRAGTSIRSTGDAAQSLRERFAQASQSGRRMGEDVATGTQRANGAVRSTSEAAQSLRERFHAASQAGSTMQVSGQPASELKAADGAAGEFGISLGRVRDIAAGLGVAFGAHQIVSFFTDAIGAAREAEAIMFRTTNTFEEAAGSVNDWASDSARSFGLSEDAAKSAALQFSSFGLAMGQSGQELADYSINLSEIAADLAAYGDYDIETVVQDMSSALSGGTETMRKYGVMLDQNTLRQIAFEEGITESNRMLTQEERVMAASVAMRDKLAYANGAAEDSQGTFGASVRDLKAGFADASAEIGAKFIPILTSVTSAIAGPGLAALSGFGTALGAVLAPVAALTTLFTGLPGPIQAAVGAMVAMRVGAALLATTMGATVASALGSAVLAVRLWGIGLAQSVVSARAAIASNGLLAASTAGVSTAMGAASRGISGLVSALGGPWMIAIAAAVGVVTSFVSASRSASEANRKLSDAAAEGASAQQDLARALAESNGAMDDQAMAAAQRVVQSELDQTSAKADQSHNMFVKLGTALNRVGGDYEQFAYQAENHSSAMVRSGAESEKARLEQQALGDALAATGLSMDDVNEIVVEGGARWEILRAALSNTGAAGEAVISQLEGSRAAIDDVMSSATEAEIASTLLSDAFRVMADESSTAEEKTNALKAALDALAGETLTADQATGKFYETMDKLDGTIGKLSEGSGDFTRTLEDGGLAFDMTSEKGRELHSTLLEMRDATAEVRDTGGDLGPIMEENHRKMEALAGQTGLTTEQLWQLAEQTGFIPEIIETLVSVDGAGAVAGELAIVSHALKDVDQGVTVEVENVSDEALHYLQSVGWEAERVEGTTDIRVVASTAEAQRGLQETNAAAARLDALEPDVQVDTNAEWVTHALNITAATTEGLPPGHIEITDTTDENLARLGALGIEVSKDKHGRVIINDADVERARGNVNSLNNNNTSSTHTVTIRQVRSDLGYAGPGFADGGIRESYADGGVSGTLPTAAKIQPASGKRGLVQWAEAETHGEAFIPLAPSKRDRSLAIWRETGRRLGALDTFADGGMLPPGDGYKGDIGGLLAAKFADGGIMAGGLIDFAKGVEGKPYVFGGIQWGDCSAAVAALANYVSGRSPFGSRFATMNERQALAERGFVSGRGGAGDLRVGWYNGGPWGGHTSATLPDGTNFEMGGARGNGQFGGQAVGADWGQYTDHAYFPMERFADIDAALGEDVYASIAEQLGTGNPEMAHVPDNRTQRQKNIDAIVAEGQRRNLSDRDIQVALMTAEQESGIRVLANPADAASMGMDHEGVGYDHDSTGIFQQRNNGAWGTLEDRMDPTKSSAMFYDQLEKIEGRDGMALTAVAQRVQGSAHPGAYAKHEGMASTELAESKKRLEQLSKQGSGSGGGKGQAVYVTNWPSGGGYGGGGGSSAIREAASAVGDAEEAAFIQENSIASFLADAAGRRDLIQKSDGGVSVTAFADGGFHGIENHSAHIAPAGSWRIFGEPETGGEAYIPLASSKRARSLDIWMETGKRLGMTGLGIAGVAGSFLTGNGLSTGWNGPSLGDLGVDTGALKSALEPGVAAHAEQAGQQVAAILADLGATIESSVDGTLQQVGADANRARQQYARALI